MRLLLGVTGSGKTEVYLEAMKQVLEKGGGVLFLVPEVSLAPQTVSRIRHYFSESGEEIVVWHSHLSAGERPRCLEEFKLRKSQDCRRCKISGLRSYT